MTGSWDTPDRRENARGTPQTGAPYPYPLPDPYRYQPAAIPGGYPPPYGGYPPRAAAPKNGLGVASLVLAVIGLVSVATVFAPIALGVAAVITGVIGHGRVKRGAANNGGVAIAGIVLGGLAIVVGLAFIAIWTTVWKDVGGGDYIGCMQKAGNDQFAQQQCADQFRRNVQDQLNITLTPTPVR
ncbi:hypothetical protein GCM10009641_55910 [Mycobacterium cookii]|uniref:DUF4190 domain-containing protein n=1 Tax=Mycobacterium cookii TaxID=1775 RepID=A0A7I7KTD4_9MYCO|nr:DUF4190 domain-containing protein [Mycobacterium cookii]MCV7332129.1 DUF4190 domain-containing protein [Mycobacterium cookii]BBX44612.1 hypothetical protein MCOO_06270 [Mycobacterium cookii]